MSVIENEFLPEVYVNKIKERYNDLKNKKVVACLSGGVDSTVAAALIKACGADIRGVLINTGFLQSGEPESTIKTLAQAGFTVSEIDCSSHFFINQKNVSTGAEKRAAFKETYFHVLEQALDEINAKYVIQGTQVSQYTTAMNNVNANRAHNHLSHEMEKKYNWIEPVAGLSKEQIRKLSSYLKLPETITSRRPFPGPGLLLRFGGEYTAEKLRIIRLATRKIDDFLQSNSIPLENCWQMFPYLIGDEKVYYIDHNNQHSTGVVLVIRAVRKESNANYIYYKPAILNEKSLEKLTDELMSIEGVARICFDLTIKKSSHNIAGEKEITYYPGGTIEYI
ncbi:hypothetical protein [Enterobacter mori]|uniref:hypothetical protein n=1 Tax=Enterobacter mori TaxID=539813 RepID=UPI001B8D37C6|nr:hypothetical protein [Enterobacter mori]MBS3046413.1 hypothetical protein [Enterobacter mori]